MDLITKIVKSLPERHFDLLLEKVGGNVRTNNYKVLKSLRNEVVNQEKLRRELGMTQGTFNTFKSRLLKKVSSQISKLEENTISLLKEETARASQMVLQNERDVAIRILVELEKKLREYDLSNELSIIYKSLARLHRFHPEYSHYEMLYKKHVAFSLTLTKAEDLLYDFIFYLSHYHLQKDEATFHKIKAHMQELDHTCLLYASHRLHVIHNIAKIYHDCYFMEPEALAMQEIKIEETLRSFQDIFNKYGQDAFYQNIKLIIPFLFFEYYVKVGNMVKASFYLKKMTDDIDNVAHMQLWPFFITQTINSIVVEYVKNGDRDLIYALENKLVQYYYPHGKETPLYICYHRFLAMVAFYKKQYPRAAKIINDLRNEVSFKNYNLVEVELKLLQSLQYALENDVELCERILASTKRQVINDEALKAPVKLFGKLLTLILKNNKDGGEIDKIVHYWRRFREKNSQRILHFVKLSLIDI